jgi:hypothetical protein
MRLARTLALVALLLATSGCAQAVNAYAIPRLTVSPYPAHVGPYASTPVWCDPYTDARSAGAPAQEAAPEDAP